MKLHNCAKFHDLISFRNFGGDLGVSSTHCYVNLCQKRPELHCKKSKVKFFSKWGQIHRKLRIYGEIVDEELHFFVHC